MIDRLRAWLTEDQRGLSGGRDELELAVAALLIEAAQIDAGFGETERAVIRRLLERRFGLSAEDARDLEAAAEHRVSGSTQLFGFVRIVNERFSRDKRVELIEMLWEVVYADGALDPLEDTLLRRVAGLVDVSDHERGAARLRVLRRLGLAEQD
jgi:uncharacterized tellurite resistance protein B-like protein